MFSFAFVFLTIFTPTSFSFDAPLSDLSSHILKTSHTDPTLLSRLLYLTESKRHHRISLSVLIDAVGLSETSLEGCSSIASIVMTMVMMYERQGKGVSVKLYPIGSNDSFYKCSMVVGCNKGEMQSAITQHMLEAVVDKNMGGVNSTSIELMFEKVMKKRGNNDGNVVLVFSNIEENQRVVLKKMLREWFWKDVTTSQKTLVFLPFNETDRLLLKRSIQVAYFNVSRDIHNHGAKALCEPLLRVAFDREYMDYFLSTLRRHEMASSLLQVTYDLMEHLDKLRILMTDKRPEDYGRVISAAVNIAYFNALKAHNKKNARINSPPALRE